MPSTLDLIAATDDADLRRRLVAILGAAGDRVASATIEQRMGEIVAQPVDGDRTIADVHAYATLARAQAVAALPPHPGADPAAATDDHLRAALTGLGLLSTAHLGGTA